MKKVFLSLFFTLTSIFNISAASLKDGKYSTKLRLYNFYKDFETKANGRASFQQGTSAGAQISYESLEYYGLSGKLTFATANHLSTASSNTDRRNPILPTSNLDVLSESYLQYSKYKTTLRGGAQIFNSPFANASDAMMIPATFRGYTLSTGLIPYSSLKLAYLDAYKSRTSDQFQNIGQWITNRLSSGATKKSTSGTFVGQYGFNYKLFSFNTAYYNFKNVHNLFYHELAIGNKMIKGMIHTGKQKESGDKLLGNFNNKMIGGNLVTNLDKFTFIIGYTDLETKTNTAWSEPFNYFTSSLQTNSMISGMGNVGNGSAYKLTVFFKQNQDLKYKLSYSDLDFDTNTKDKSEIDFDVIWKIKKLGGLKLWNRIASISSDTKANEVIALRTMLEYNF